MISLGRRVQRASDPVGDAAGPARQEGVVSADYNIVSEDYFATMGIPVLRGRPFRPAEAAGGTSTAAIVDRLAAEKLWPHGEALGQSIRLLAGDEGKQPQVVTIVGIVDNVQQHLIGQQETPHVYLPFGPEFQSDVNLHLRLADGGRGAARFLAGVRGEVASVDAKVPVLTARTLRQHLDSSFDVWLMRTASRLFALFGAVALVLAAVGLYGVRAFAVARRTREIGIRMAVGASAGDAVRLILREGMALTLLGAGAGLLLSLALGRVLAGMLYRVSGSDPLVLGAAAAVLAGVSLLACYVPARRAARIAPMVSLRND
jgi:ABC-type antimicrobial peptide transport system permease subunit